MNANYFNRNTTEYLKGWLSMGVLSHHIFLSTHFVARDTVLGFFMSWLGACCVSTFFFISGYGLMTSFAARGGYLASYQRNRVLPIFAINAFLVVFYAAQKILFGEEVTVPNIALSFFYGGNVVTFGWYLLCIMVFYELFYASAKFFGKHICLAITVMTLMYIALAMMLKMSGWWYMSCLTFPSGVIFAHYKKNIDAVICHHTALVLLSFFNFYGNLQPS